MFNNIPSNSSMYYLGMRNIGNESDKLTIFLNILFDLPISQHFTKIRSQKKYN